MDTAQLIAVCAAYTSHSQTSDSLCTVLDNASKILARSENDRSALNPYVARRVFAQRRAAASASETIQKYGTLSILSGQLTARAAEDDALDSALCLSISRCTRNLVAGVPANQDRA